MAEDTSMKEDPTPSPRRIVWAVVPSPDPSQGARPMVASFEVCETLEEIDQRDKEDRRAELNEEVQENGN